MLLFQDQRVRLTSTEEVIILRQRGILVRIQDLVHT